MTFQKWTVTVLLFWVCCGSASCPSAVALVWLCCAFAVVCCVSTVALLWLSYTSALAMQITVSLTRPWSASRIWTIDTTWSLFSMSSQRKDRGDSSDLPDYSPRSQYTKHSALDFERIPVPCESEITEQSLCGLTDLAWMQCQFCHFASSRTTATYLSSSNWEVWSSHQTALSYNRCYYIIEVIKIHTATSEYQLNRKCLWSQFLVLYFVNFIYCDYWILCGKLFYVSG